MRYACPSAGARSPREGSELLHLRRVDLANIAASWQRITSENSNVIVNGMDHLASPLSEGSWESWRDTGRGCICPPFLSYWRRGEVDGYRVVDNLNKSAHDLTWENNVFLGESVVEHPRNRYFAS
jgi:hypothetical protein